MFGPKQLQAFLDTCKDAAATDEQVIGLLAGADQTSVRIASHSPFRSACENGRTAVATFIATEFKYLRDDALADSGYALRWACANGQVNTVQWIVAEFAVVVDDIRAVGNFALVWACANGQSAIAGLLFASFLDRSDFATDSFAPFRFACINGFGDLAMSLGDTFDITATEITMTNDPVEWACAKGQLDLLEWLIGKGVTEADIHADGDLALTMAAVPGQFPILQYLLNNFTFSTAAINQAADAADASSRPDVAAFLRAA